MAPRPLYAVYWEYPSDPQQGADFVALLDAVRQWLPDDQFIVTAALPADRSLLSCIDVHAAAAYLDSVNLMAYDFYGPWTARSGHHAQLYSMSSSSSSSSSSSASAKDDGSPSAAGSIAHLVARGCPASRINLGIPVYGRSFPGVTGPGHRPKGGHGGEDGTGAFEYRHLPRRGAKETTDKRVGAASCVGGDGGFVSYDNPDTVKMKARFCKQKGLGVSIVFFRFVYLTPFLSSPSRERREKRKGVEYRKIWGRSEGHGISAPHTHPHTHTMARRISWWLTCFGRDSSTGQGRPTPKIHRGVWSPPGSGHCIRRRCSKGKGYLAFKATDFIGGGFWHFKLASRRCSGLTMASCTFGSGLEEGKKGRLIQNTNLQEAGWRWLGNS